MSFALKSQSYSGGFADRLDLNDFSTYEVQRFMLGSSRRESWIEPWNGIPQLVKNQQLRVATTIALTIRAASVAAVRTAVEDIRDEFSDREGILSWNYGDAVQRVMTFPSNIVTMDERDERTIYLVDKLHVLPVWEFQVWRSATLLDATNALTTAVPVM